VSAKSSAGKTAIFGECKWSSAETGEQILNDVIRKSELLQQFTKKHYILFSRSGFSGALMSRAEMSGKIMLINPACMF